jgi:hypothetical protein
MVINDNNLALRILPAISVFILTFHSASNAQILEELCPVGYLIN